MSGSFAALMMMSCGASFQNPADSSHAGAAVSEYELMPFSGGSVHVRLASDGYNVAEWITSTYACPVVVDMQRRTSNLRPLSPPLTSAILPPGVPVRLAVWEVVDRDSRWDEHTDAQTQFGDPTAKPAPYAYGLPFAVGEAHRVQQGFNGLFSHTGDDVFAVDFGMPEGSTIRAARDGIVVAFNDKAVGNGVTPEFKDRSRANWIILRHSDGTLGAYWHLKQNGVRVKVAQHVARGDVIGLSGATGYATSPHLHFEVRTAINGLHIRSFWFAFKSAPNDQSGEPPKEGQTYTAFE